MRHTGRAFHPDGVSGQKVFILVDTGREEIDKGSNAVIKVERRLQGQSTDAEVRGHHALSADLFKEAQNILAFAETVQKYRHGSHIEGMGTEPDQMAGDTSQLIEHDS